MKNKLQIILAVVFLVVCFTGKANAQNAIVGSGFTAGWDNADFEYFSEIVSGSYGRTEQANGTGNQYFRIGVDWDGTVEQHTLTNTVDTEVTNNTEYNLTSGSTTSGAMYINVASVADNYVFKTRNAGSTPDFDLVIFKVEGDIRSVSSVGNSVTGNAIHGEDVIVTATLDGSFSTGQSVYIRYTDDSYATSTLVEMSGSGTSYTATIPGSVNQIGSSISYYVFTSGNGLTISADDSDFYTINLNNNAGSNYEYDVYSEVEISGTAGWRLLSIPKTGATAADISDDGIGAQFTTNTDSATIYTYDDTGSFEAISSDATTIDDGFGLAVYFFDNTTAGSSELPITLDVSGSEPSSDVTVSGNILTLLSSSYFTLLGNPFASNFNTNDMSVSAGLISNNIHLWNDGTSTYSTGDRTTDYIIAPWQGFWVEATSVLTTDITFPTSGKTSSSTSGTFFSKTAENRGDIAFSLTSENSYDEAIKLAVREYATLGMDRADASKLVPLVPAYATMAFNSDDKLKSVESLPWDLTEEVKLDLELTQVAIDGNFTFDWQGLESIPSDWAMTFHDYKTGATIDMRTATEYTFDAAAPATEKVNPINILTGPVAMAQKSKSAGSRFGITITPNTTSVNNEPGSEVRSFALDQNYPNPFNPTTTINYSVENSGAVTLSVYNLMGQKVAELVNETKSAGSYNVSWNASQAASGMYYYRLEAGGQVLTRKMTLIK